MGKFVHLINWGFDLQVISVVKTIKKKKKKTLKSYHHIEPCQLISSEN